MSVSYKYVSRKIAEQQSLIDVTKKIQEFITEQTAIEASLADAIATDSEKSIRQKVHHIQNQLSYTEISKELNQYILKTAEDNEKILQAYNRERERKNG